MKKRYLNIDSFFITLLLLLQVKFFYLIPFDFFYSINSNQQQILMVCIMMVWILLNGIKKIFNKGNSFNKYIFIYILIYLIELIISILNNGQGILNAFIASNFYLIILMYGLVLNYIKKNGYQKLLKIILIISFFNLFFCWVQYILSFYDIYFMNEIVTTTRFGTLRIYDIGDTLTCLGIILSFTYYLFYNKKKYLFMFLIGFLGQLIIGKGRVVLIALFLSIVTILLSKYKNSIKKITYASFLILLSFLIFSMTDIGKSYVASLSDNNNTGSIRIREIIYYNNQTKEHLFTGTGFIRDLKDEKSYYLRGPNYTYSRTDVGIFGLANVFGIGIVIWYLLLSISIYKKIRNSNEKNELYYISVGLFTFSIIYIPTMIMINPYSITTFSLLLCFADYIENKKKRSD